MRTLRGWGAVVLAATFLIGGASAAFADGTITTPASNPFNVPGDAAGNPQSFTIVAGPYTGLTGAGAPFAQECDGVSHTDPDFVLAQDCDPFNVTSRRDVVSGSDVTFPAGDANYGFFPSKENTLSRWHCIAPGDTPPADGKPSFTNCQVRVSTDPNTVQTSDSWLTMTFPTAAPPAPSCSLGAGLVQKPPKPNKNTGLDKISKGLLPAAALKDTKHKLTSTAEGCVGFPVAPKTGNPITTGSIQVQTEMTPGADCTSIVTGTIVKSKVTVKWNSIDPKSLKPKTVATDKATLTSFTRTPGGIPVTFHAVTSALDIKSVFFNGKHLEFNFVMDQTQAQLDNACNDAKGKGIFSLTFTGVMGASSVTVLP